MTEILAPSSRFYDRVHDDVWNCVDEQIQMLFYLQY